MRFYHINTYKLYNKIKNMELVAILSRGEGTWGQVSGLVKKGEWEKIVLLGPNYASNFQIEGIPFDFIEYDDNKGLLQLKQFFLEKLKDKFSSFNSEVAVSIASGQGKEHMALLSALLSIPVGVRFTALTKDGVVFL
jgi:hypothetical protein